MSFFYIYIYRGIRKLFYYFILTIFISTIKHLTSHYGIVLHFSFCSKCCKNPTTTIIIVFLIKPCSFLYFKGTGYAEHYDSLPSAIDSRSLNYLKSGMIKISVAEPKLFIFGSGSDFDHNFGSGSGYSSSYSHILAL